MFLDLIVIVMYLWVKLQTLQYKKNLPFLTIWHAGSAFMLLLCQALSRSQPIWIVAHSRAVAIKMNLVGPDFTFN